MNEEKKVGEKTRQEITIDELEKTIKGFGMKEGAILDVGCCNNKFKNRIEKMGIHWVGMDIKQEKDVSLKGKMEDIPLHDGIITCILCSHVFEHTVDPIKTLSEFKRVLKSNGLLFIVCPYPTQTQIFGMDKTHWFVFNPDQLLALLQKCGFVVMRNELIKDSDGFDNIITVALSV